MLNLPHQLQEGRHHTKRNRTIAQAEPAPNKGKQITKPKRRTQRKTRNRRKPGTANHIALQVLLCIKKSVCRPTFTFHGTQHRVKFNSFLHLHLDFAFAVSNRKRHVTELARHKLAKHNRHRCQQQQRPRKPRIKPTHQKERAHQLQRRHNHLRHRFHGRRRNILDIFRKPRRHITRMKFRPRIKFASKETFKNF